jgi:16S rRNA (cytidine1402-2'-O)-methyltransferase
VLECVDDLAAVLGGGRTAVLARELTKAFESVHAGELGAARAWLEGDPNRVRGEFVILVSGAPPAADASGREGERVLARLLVELPVKTAVRLAAEITGAPRNALYAQALALKSPPAGRRKRGR